MERLCPSCRGKIPDGWARNDGRYDCFRCGKPVNPNYVPGQALRMSSPSPQFIGTPRSFSTAGAVVLWLFLGAIGVHRFYLGQTTYGFVMFFVNPALTVLTAGLWLPVAGIWWIVEGCLLPSSLRRAREGR